MGADRTVLTAALFAVLGFETTQADIELNGLGGTTRADIIRTRIRLTDTRGRKVEFRGEFAAAGDTSLLDTCVLGRDISNLFAVIIDWPGDTVCLLRGNDRYGSLASQWIPLDKSLWKVANYLDFLEARKELLAAEANRVLAGLLHGETRWLEGPAAAVQRPAIVPGGITSEAEEEEIEAVNGWMESQQLPRGQVAFDFADAETGNQRAVFDLAWPTGIQEELSEPVAVLLNETAETLAVASSAGFRCFTSVSDFKTYVQTQILALELTEA